jgi:cobalt-zinc-cadmium efflux system outer membrane protein
LIFDFEYYLDNATKNYGVSIAFPIFEIKSLIFRYLNAKKDHEMSKYTQKRVMLESENALRTTYFSLREALAKIDLARKSLDAAEEATIIAREQYALGLVSFLDLLAAEKAIYDARVSYTSALSDYYQQGAKFSYLLGNAVVNKEQ